MNNYSITKDEVIERCKYLTSFPPFVHKILTSLDDENHNTDMLVGYIKQDQVMVARIISLANMAANNNKCNNVHNAIAMVGEEKVRQLAIQCSVGQFVNKLLPNLTSDPFWWHSVSVGVVATELADYTGISSGKAQVAGLLHDIGQLWMTQFRSNEFREVCQYSIQCNVNIEHAEYERFGTDHAEVGAWLAECWNLPDELVASIRNHHLMASSTNDELLVPLIHIADVLANALDLACRDVNRVGNISNEALRRLGLVFDDSIDPLFGRIVARSRHLIHNDISER
jgi:putative nucleotidyltransferase with HDIG domain